MNVCVRLHICNMTREQNQHSNNDGIERWVKCTVARPSKRLTLFNSMRFNEWKQRNTRWITHMRFSPHHGRFFDVCAEWNDVQFVWSATCYTLYTIFFSLLFSFTIICGKCRTTNNRRIMLHWGSMIRMTCNVIYFQLFFALWQRTMLFDLTEWRFDRITSMSIVEWLGCHMLWACSQAVRFVPVCAYVHKELLFHNKLCCRCT